MTDHDDLGTITPLRPGTLVDVTIKGVPVEYEHDEGSITIRDEHGIHYLMPPQAAVKRSDLTSPTDAGTLQERISKAISAIDNMADEQTLDPWTALAIRQQLDPNPRYWPPQPGDVWDDGMPFGGSLWFAQVVHETKRSHLVMVPVERDPENARVQTPDELLESTPGFHGLKLVYRKDGGQ